MSDTLGRLAACIEHGKDESGSPFPPDLVGEDGALELTRLASSCWVSRPRMWMPSSVGVPCRLANWSSFLMIRSLTSIDESDCTDWVVSRTRLLRVDIRLRVS